jgi:hypothetical protein
MPLGTDMSELLILLALQDIDESWNGKGFLTKQDVEEMGADMRSPDPLAYSREGSAHKYSMGLDELQMMVWACKSEAAAEERFTKEKKDDENWCKLALKMGKATTAEIAASDLKEPSYLKKVVRGDGWRIATYVARVGRFVVKLGRQENKDGLDEAIERGKKAVEYAIKKLKSG